MPQPALQCLKCGTPWHPDHGAEWGRTHDSIGNGPDARCTQLVPNHTAPKARTRDPNVFEVPMQLCNGILMPVQIPDNEVNKIKRPRPVGNG